MLLSTIVIKTAMPINNAIIPLFIPLNVIA